MAFSVGLQSAARTDHENAADFSARADLRGQRTPRGGGAWPVSSTVYGRRCQYYYSVAAAASFPPNPSPSTAPWPPSSFGLRATGLLRLQTTVSQSGAV